MEFNAAGERSGFFVELAKEISAEIGVEVRFRDYASPPEVIAAQISGETQLFAGSSRHSQLRDTTLFSIPVAQEELRLTVLSERADEFGPDAFEGKRIGHVKSMLGYGGEALFDRNTPIEFPTTEAAVMGLLLGQVDILLIPNTVVYDIARRAGADGRIRFVGEPLKTTDRMVSLHNSRADLLPAINRAITRIEFDGRLEALRQRYSLFVPPPAPDVLSVAIAHSPPFGILEDGKPPSGFSAEVIRDLMERAGLEFAFVELTLEGYFEAFRLKRHDIIPAVLASDEARALYDLTDTIDLNPLAVLTRENGSFQSLDDLRSARVGALEDTVIALRESDLTFNEAISFADYGQLDAALAGGEIDAIIEVESALEAEGLTTKYLSLGSPGFALENAIALRPGLGFARERLNAVIPGYLLSDDYLALRETYFGEPVYWTDERIHNLLMLVGGGFLLGMGSILGLWYRSRALKVARNQSISAKEELETIFNAATSGIVGLDAEGAVVRINAQGRALLGQSGPVPFFLPDHVRFIDIETLKQTDKSNHPFSRAVAGQELDAEVCLLDLGEGKNHRRYVRISSAPSADAIDGVVAVVVLDDVSNEERNRRVIERKGRLDALGQLTGGIAHDFNNLLAAQLMAVEGATETSDASTRAEMLQMTTDSILRGRSLTTRLLSFARQQPGLATSRNTAEILSDFEKLVRPLLEKNVAIEIDKVDKDLFQFCDPTQLETALMNCVLNSRDAILAAGKGSTIRLSARSVDGKSVGIDPPADVAPYQQARFIEFSITDDGPGMDEETLARCTDPFFTTKETHSGTGLGLAMVFGFARQSDGDLRIYSEEGTGTTVQLLIPRGTDQGQKEKPVALERVPMGHGETILVAEDEPLLLRLVKTALEDLSYKVVTADNGDEAFALVQSGLSFDLLLTDVMMPGELGGFDLARKLREIAPDKPVIYMSGYTGFTSAEMGTVKTPLIQKPATKAEIAKVLEETLRG